MSTTKVSSLMVQVLSDWHTEFWNGDLSGYFSKIRLEKTCKLCIVAGDLGLLKKRDELSEAFTRLTDVYDKVLYVLGNHEFYNLEWEQALSIANDVTSKNPNVVWLRTGKVFEYEGLRFLGDTMWFTRHPNISIARTQINDFHVIKGLEPACYEHSSKFLNFLTSDCRRGDIVITHHLPHSKSTHPMFVGLPSNCVFTNYDAEQIFGFENRPGVWIHGHTHGKALYEVNDVKVICNPIGYPKENGSLPEAAEPSVYEFGIGRGVESVTKCP